MWYLCICQQPDNSDLFKGHGPASLGGLWIELQWEGGLAQVEDKAQRWRVQMCDTMYY